MTGDNPTSQAERLAAHQNDERVRKGATYFDLAAAEAGVARGRFTAREKSTVVGSTAAPSYPAGPNWSADPVGQEPPTGVAIDQMEPVGEAIEVRRSLLRETVDDEGMIPTKPSNASPSGDARSDAPPASSDAPSPPQSKRKSRKRG